jgi:hypothetical protein
MRKYFLASVAAIALALGATAAGAQDSEQQRGAESEQGRNAGLIALDEQKQTRVGDIIRQQRIKPVTNLNFSLSVAGTVPSSVRLARISGELADIFPNYRDFSFFVARQELVIVDPQSHAIVGFAPISAGDTAGAAPPRQNTGTVGAAERPPPPAARNTARTGDQRVTATQEKPEANRGAAGAAPPSRNAGAVGATEPPSSAKQHTARTRHRRATVTEQEQRPNVPEPGAIPRGPAQTETDVTVGTARRRSEAFDEAPPPPPRDRAAALPARERPERDQGPPFPFSLLFGRW